MEWYECKNDQKENILAKNFLIIQSVKKKMKTSSRYV